MEKDGKEFKSLVVVLVSEREERGWNRVVLVSS